MSHRLSLAAVAAVALAGLTVSPAHAITHAAPRAAAPTTDPAPGKAAAAWLTSQLTHGLIHNDQYDVDDYGLSIDTALGLDALGGHGSTVTAVSKAVAAKISSYISGDPGDKGSTYAGSVAKALVLAEVAKADPTSYGGVDLVARLEKQVGSSGRIADTSTYGDYANVLGQSFAATGLALANSPKAASATSFLLQQQCSDGYFRLSFSDPKAADQACGAKDAANTDATAIAVVELLDQPSTPAIKTAVADAEAWLARTQAANGSFGSDAPTKAPNANSTGLAGWALGAGGNTAAAAKAAVWVRQHQLAGLGVCQPFAKADVGALAYDQKAYTAARSATIDDKTADQFRRATAQALPVLAYAPGESRTTGASGIGTYFRPGATFTATLRGQAPGSPVCGYLTKQPSSATLVVTDASAVAHARIPLPQATGIYPIRVSTTSSYLTARVEVLGPLTIPFAFAKASVPAGGTQTVRAHGLGVLERVRVSYRGKVVASGRSDKHGNAVLRFPVGSKPGTYPVTVTGRFADIRKNTQSFTVTS